MLQTNMSSMQVEARALDIVDRVRADKPIEDVHVELKADWPKQADRAARRLAGHCNAARGEPVLWLIVVDEQQGVTGASFAQVSDWLAQVRACFDGVYPELARNQNISVNTETIVALLFDTTRSPFVVKNPVHGHRVVGRWKEKSPGATGRLCARHGERT